MHENIVQMMHAPHTKNTVKSSIQTVRYKVDFQGNKMLLNHVIEGTRRTKAHIQTLSTIDAGIANQRQRQKRRRKIEQTSERRKKMSGFSLDTPNVARRPEKNLAEELEIAEKHYNDVYVLDKCIDKAI